MDVFAYDILDHLVQEFYEHDPEVQFDPATDWLSDDTLSFIETQEVPVDGSYGEVIERIEEVLGY